VSAGHSWLTQLFSGDHLNGMVHEDEQDLKGLLLELDFDAVFAQFACADVQLKCTEARCAIG
jgi:hypothetical protein